MISDSMALGLTWFEGRSLRGSIDWQVIQFEIQWVWNSKNETWKLKNEVFQRNFLQK